MEVLLYVAAILFFICYVPQIIKMLKTKEVDDISPIMWALAMIGYSCGLIYFLFHWKFSMVLNYSSGLTCSLIIFVLYYKWREKEKPK